MSKVITANVLATGAVVFFGSEKRWVRSIDQAFVYGDGEAAEQDLQAARQDAERAIVVDPFVVGVTTRSGAAPAMSLRDTIRAHGPTIKYLPPEGMGSED